MIKILYQKRTDEKTLSQLAWELLEKACLEAGIEYTRERVYFGGNGKPYIQDNPFYFNLSHSDEYALCVLSDREVGCDIQKVKKPVSSVIERFFCDEEKEYILQAESEAERALRFTRIWTLRESYVKYTGEGLKRSFHSFYFRLEEDQPALFLQEDRAGDNTGGFFVRALPPPTFCEMAFDGYQCAFCYEQ